MIITKVGRRGQITLQKEVRNELRLNDGDRVGFIQKGGECVLQPIRTTLKDHRGTVPVDGPQDFKTVRNQVRQVRAENRNRNAE